MKQKLFIALLLAFPGARLLAQANAPEVGNEPALASMTRLHAVADHLNATWLTVHSATTLSRSGYAAVENSFKEACALYIDALNYESSLHHGAAADQAIAREIGRVNGLLTSFSHQ